MENIVLGGLVGGVVSAALFAVLVFLMRQWFVSRLEQSLRKELSLFNADLERSNLIQLRAERVARYLALVHDLPDHNGPDYREANQLAWELALWLPDDLYRMVVKSIAEESWDLNRLTVIAEVRRYLLGVQAAGNLTSDDIARHSPGIGKVRS
jgi:hypothetical protein